MEEEDGVWLKLHGDKIQFEATNNSVAIRIPLSVWEFIRCKHIMDLSFADKTDEELLSETEKDVDQRIEQYAKAKNNREKSIVALSGAFLYGDVESTREEQIENALKCKKDRRDKFLKIKNDIKEFKSYI